MPDGRGGVPHGRVGGGVRVLAAGAGVAAARHPAAAVAVLHGLHHLDAAPAVHDLCRIPSTVLRPISLEW